MVIEAEKLTGDNIYKLPIIEEDMEINLDNDIQVEMVVRLDLKK